MVRRTLIGFLLAIGAMSQMSSSIPGHASTAMPGDCPRDTIAFRGQMIDMVCHCAADATGAGPIWGTEIYADDSPICSAAVHQGVIDPSGGQLFLEVLPGQDSYEGTQANGIRSFPSGPRPGSYRIVRGSEGRGDIEACPYDATSLRGRDHFRCRCGPHDVQAGSVWGTDVYTDDSSICRAALHAGVIGEFGGQVTVWPQGAEQFFAGTHAHGVTSRDFGLWEWSFTFPVTGGPPPPAPPQPGG